MILSNTFASFSLSEDSSKKLVEFFLDKDLPNFISSKYIHLTIVESENIVNIPIDYFLGTLFAEHKHFSYGTFPSGETNQNTALVLVFNDKNIFDFQNKITSFFDVPSVHPKFIPHITLSYNIPDDFDYENLPLPDFDLIFDNFSGCEIPDISNLEEELQKLFL